MKFLITTMVLLLAYQSVYACSIDFRDDVETTLLVNQVLEKFNVNVQDIKGVNASKVIYSFEGNTNGTSCEDYIISEVKVNLKWKKGKRNCEVNVLSKRKEFLGLDPVNIDMQSFESLYQHLLDFTGFTDVKIELFLRKVFNVSSNVRRLSIGDPCKKKIPSFPQRKPHL